MEKTSFSSLKRRCHKYIFWQLLSRSQWHFPVWMSGDSGAPWGHGSQPRCGNSAPSSTRMLNHSLHFQGAGSRVASGKKTCLVRCSVY